MTRSLLLLGAPALFAASVLHYQPLNVGQGTWAQLLVVLVLMLPLPLTFAGSSLLFQLGSRRNLPAVLAVLLATTITALSPGTLVA